MGRYIGPKSKIARKFGEAIFGADRVLEKRNFPPGQHGLARKRKKVSEYGQHLSQKQKARLRTVFWRNSSPVRTSRLPVWAVSRVRTC